MKDIKELKSKIKAAWETDFYAFYSELYEYAKTQIVELNPVVQYKYISVYFIISINSDEEIRWKVLDVMIDCEKKKDFQQYFELCLSLFFMTILTQKKHKNKNEKFVNSLNNLIYDEVLYKKHNMSEEEIKKIQMVIKDLQEEYIYK